jgi:hypothetical protein
VHPNRQRLLHNSEYEPNRKITTKQSSGPLRFTNMRSVEAVPGGTRVTEAGEGQTGGYSGFSFVIGRWLQG